MIPVAVIESAGRAGPEADPQCPMERRVEGRDTCRCRVVRPRQRQRHPQHAARIEARTHVEEIDQRSAKEGHRDEEDEGEGDLPADEQTTQPAIPRRGGDTTTEGIDQIASDGMKHRQRPKEYAAYESEARDDPDRAPADRYLPIGNRSELLEREPCHHRPYPHGEQHTGEGPEKNERSRLDEQLFRDFCAARSQRGPDRHLTATVDRADHE